MNIPSKPLRYWHSHFPDFPKYHYSVASFEAFESGKKQNKKEKEIQKNDISSKKF